MKKKNVTFLLTVPVNSKYFTSLTLVEHFLTRFIPIENISSHNFTGVEYLGYISHRVDCEIFISENMK